MKRWTSTIFKILEKAWRLQNCILVDMKIEFGFDQAGINLIFFLFYFFYNLRKYCFG